MTELRDVEFMTALEKKKVLKQWETFLMNGCERENFTKPLYQHLINHCSFIAHYDIDGFYFTYFKNGEDTAHFLTQFDGRYGIPRSIEYNCTYWFTDPDYSDINQEMCLIVEVYIDSLSRIARDRQEKLILSRQGCYWLNMD